MAHACFFPVVDRLRQEDCHGATSFWIHNETLTKMINTLVRGILFETRECNQKTVDYLALFRELTCGLFGLGLLGLLS